MQTKSNTTAPIATATPTPAAAKPTPTPSAKPAPKAAAKKPAPKKPAPKAAAPTVKADKPDAQAIAAIIHKQRVTAASVFKQADNAVSVPIKPIAAYKRTYNADVQAHAIGRKPTSRQAAALAVAITASGKKPANGITFARKFDINGAQYAIENGALSDCIASGLATYNGKTQTITLRNTAELSAQLGAISIKL